MNILPVLKRGRELISEKDRWTQGALAKSEAGLTVDPNSKHAVCYCSMGALIKGLPPGDLKAQGSWCGSKRYSLAKEALIRALPGLGSNDSVITYNDRPRRSHKTILAWWDRAIQLETRRQARKDRRVVR